MISYNSIKDIEEDSDDILILKMTDIPEYDIEDYDLMDEKDREKYIKDLERIVRNSFEYRRAIAYIKENMDMNQCAVFENVSGKDNYKVKVELHHSPFTLYDICQTVLNKRIALGLPTNIELVALEVTALHYYLFVGLIPLSETVHQLVHSQYLFIPIDKVLGNYQAFIDIYHDYIAPELLETFEENLEYSEKLQENNLDILKSKPTYINSDNQLPTYSSMIKSLSDRVEEIKQLDNPFVTPKQITKGIEFVPKDIKPGIVYE